MDYNNFAAWMIAGGRNARDPEDDRNLEHLRALEASLSAKPSIVSRLSAAIAAIRQGASQVDPECEPA
jgi:hypothetical protein